MTARSVLEEARGAFESLHSPWHAAYAYSYLGQLSTIEGDFQEADSLLRLASGVARDAADSQALRAIALRTAEMEVWLGHWERARQHFEPFLHLDQLQMTEQTLGDVDVLLVLCTLAPVYAWLRRVNPPRTPPVPPEELTTYAVSRSRSLQINNYLQVALCAHGEVLALQGEWEGASTSIGEALTLSREMKFRGKEVTTLRSKAILHRLKGEPYNERESIEEAAALLQALGARRMAEQFALSSVGQPEAFPPDNAARFAQRNCGRLPGPSAETRPSLSPRATAPTTFWEQRQRTIAYGASMYEEAVIRGAIDGGPAAQKQPSTPKHAGRG